MTSITIDTVNKAMATMLLLIAVAWATWVTRGVADQAAFMIRVNEQLARMDGTFTSVNAKLDRLIDNNTRNDARIDEAKKR